MTRTISVIIPAKNEAQALQHFLPRLKTAYPDFEIIVVDDGSIDETQKIAEQLGAKVFRHPYSMGNGAAIKTGARNAKGDVFVFMDGDGQHQPSDLSQLLNKFAEGYDMVVGARNRHSQASFFRWMGNSFGNYLASKIVNHSILDLTSGFRIVDAKKFKEFLYMLPNGFSSPSTITIAFFRAAYSVAYIGVEVKPRIGHSHLRLFSDSVKIAIIIYKMTILYSPLKVLLPLSLLHFLLGLSNYLFTYFTMGRFTNMSVVLFSASIIIFLIGLVSEQITMLIYAHNSAIQQKK